MNATAHVKADRYPTLRAMLDAGTVWLEEGCYVARAADGVIVQVGSIGGERATDDYLRANPTPGAW